MNRLDVNYINIFSDYTVWAEGENLYFVTDYDIKYLVCFDKEEIMLTFATLDPVVPAERHTAGLVFFYKGSSLIGHKFTKSRGHRGGRLIAEVPVLDVVVEADAVGAAEPGQDLQNLLLLFWGDHVFTVMDPVVGAIAATEG